MLELRSSTLSQNGEYKILSPAPEYVVEKELHPVAIFEVLKRLFNKPRKIFDWRKWLNFLFFIGAIILGLCLILFTAGLNVPSLLGGMFFNGGFDPLMLSAFALTTGATKFYRQNLIKIAVSLALLAVGIYLLHDADAGIEATIGSAFFEFGALFFITKFFFMVEDNEIIIERLEKQLEEAKRSPGMGMALSYYYNFVVPTAANLSESGTTDISMEIGRGQFENYSLTNSHLLIFIPRTLDGYDLKTFLRKISDDKAVIQGKPIEKPGKGTHRPMFVYFMQWDTSHKTCNYLFDIPTIISSIWNRAQDQKVLKVNIEQE